MRKASELTDMFSLMNPGSGDSVGARIRLLRQHRGLTQAALARTLGEVSRSAVALWETNRGGEARHLPRIAEVLGVSVEYFVNGMARHDITQTLSVDEHALITLYRECALPEQLTLLRAAGRLGKQSRRRRPQAPPGDRPSVR